MRKFEPTTQNRRDLHSLDAYQRANYKVILWTWKAVHNKRPKILLDILPPRIINEKLRSASDYSRIGVPQHPPSKKTKTCYLYNSQQYNALPDSIRSIKDEKVFKKALKTYLF